MTAGDTAPPQLTDTEWSAVAIALGDAERCGCGPERSGRLHRLGERLFGLEPHKPLANPRLEALRRFVCASRRTRRPALELAPELVRHGLNDAQIEAIGLLSA